MKDDNPPILKDNVNYFIYRVRNLEQYVDFKRLPTYDEVLKQNQKYKEVIDKAIKYINDNSWYFNDEDSGAMFCLEEEKEETFCNDLLSILKEVK